MIFEIGSGTLSSRSTTLYVEEEEKKGNKKRELKRLSKDVLKNYLHRNWRRKEIWFHSSFVWVTSVLSSNG